MTQRPAAPPAPGPLEPSAQPVADLFRKLQQREACRHDLAGRVLPTERTTTLTALANAAPSGGAQDAAVQQLPWFLAASTWAGTAIATRRVAPLRAGLRTAPAAAGGLGIAATGARKGGTTTAQVGRQYLGNVGTVDTGGVTVGSLWADAHVYSPLVGAPCTPRQRFPGGRSDPAERTKPQIAAELVAQAVAAGIPFRAVVAGSCYGATDTFRTGLAHLGVGAVLALRPAHAWSALVGTVTSLVEVARGAAGDGPDAPGAWQPVVRAFRDGHTAPWGALDVTSGPYGPDQRHRAVIATTAPAPRPAHATWYLLTHLPAAGVVRAAAAVLPAADVAAVVRRDGLRNSVEQRSKQVQAARGGSAYQVRNDPALRRHWALVGCACGFGWWARGEEPVVPDAVAPPPAPPPAAAPARGETAAPAAAAAATPVRPRVSGPVALRRVRAWLAPWIMRARCWRGWSAPPPPPPRPALLAGVGQGHPIAL